MKSPFEGKSQSEWLTITENLVKEHPLKKDETVKIILESWQCIFKSQICDLQIGKDIFPNPQMMGFFIESIVAAKLAEKHPTVWKHGKEKKEKDIVCLTDGSKSFEIKSSSNPTKIFSNRSYAQEQSESASKGKNGFYLTVNFEKFTVYDGLQQPEINLIRFGYLDHTDWRAQKPEKGQQASLSPDTYKNKFLTWFEKSKTEKKIKKE